LTHMDDYPPMAGVYTASFIQLIVAGLVLAALLIQDRGLALLGLTVMLLHVLARIWSRAAAGRVTARVRLDRRRVFPGDPVRMTLTLDNRSRLPVWVQADVQRDAAGTASNEAGEALNMVLPGRSGARMDWTLTPTRRGVYTLGPGRMQSGDLLGWFPRTVPGANPAELVVYPGLMETSRLDLAKLEYFGAPGAKSPVLDPIYIMGARDWAPNRPARYIHWRASVRLNRWQEKVFDPSAQAKVLLALDVSGFTGPEADERFERTLSLLASLAAGYHRRGRQVGLMANGRLSGDPQGLAADGSVRPIGGILELLARQTVRAERPLADLMLERPALSGRVSVVFAFHGWDAAAESAAAVLTGRGRPAVMISARPESRTTPPMWRLDDLVAGEAGI